MTTEGPTPPPIPARRPSSSSARASSARPSRITWLERGWRDIVVVDQGPIPWTGGSTSHAPGGFFATNYSRAMTRLALETVELLGGLEVDGAPCFYPVGTIELARTPERWADHRRKLGVAQSWGVPGARVISPEETRELVPLARPVAVPRGVPRPGGRDRKAAAGRDGAAPRSDGRRRVHARARDDGDRLRRPGGGAPRRPDRPWRDLDAARRGLWRDLGAAARRDAPRAVPLTPCEHQYAITTPVAALAGETARSSTRWSATRTWRCTTASTAIGTASARTGTSRCSSTRVDIRRHGAAAGAAARRESAR